MNVLILFQAYDILFTTDNCRPDLVTLLVSTEPAAFESFQYHHISSTSKH